MATSEHETLNLKAKRPHSQHSNTAIGPVSFYLRSESEMEHSLASKLSTEDESAASSLDDTTYGVQSLEDAMQVSADSLSRTSSNESDSPRKRRPGNPVHPKIYATGQRIVSSERPQLHIRRPSMSSTSLTPLNLSPHPDTSTPRTNSVKSFQLSDEEASVTSDTGSQAIQSSSSEEDVEVRIPQASFSSEQQLVMPSIAMPQRRPFTQRGAAISQLKIMVVGATSLGKTSLIKNMYRLCEDIVYIDGMTSSTPSLSTASSQGASLAPTTTITELRASSKSIPAWSAEHTSDRSRRNSYPDRLLDRNLRFVDTPGIDSESTAHTLLKEVDSWLQPGLQLDSMNDEQLLDLLRGRSDSSLDAVIYLFDAEAGPLSTAEIQLAQQLSLRTNIIPVIAKADTQDPAQLEARKDELMQSLTAAGVEISFINASGNNILAISSVTDDGDIMDASTLMASAYIPPLRSSDLPEFVQQLFEPAIIERLRHKSMLKFLLWRRSVLTHDQQKAARRGYSSYFRSASPSSDSSGPLFGQSPYTLPRHQPVVEPTRHIRIAKWARDLQRSLRREDHWREDQMTQPLKGRLGGELAVIDPKDPLGILSMTHSFGARGWLALQVVGSCGLITATVWWCARNWVQWHSWFWPLESYSPAAIPAPSYISWPSAFKVT